MSNSAQPAELSEAEFEQQYGSTTPDDGYFEYEDVKDAPINHVWTVVEGDDEFECEDGEYRSNLYALPGFHHVNRLGYIRTDKPWTDENIVAIYFDIVAFSNFDVRG